MGDLIEYQNSAGLMAIVGGLIGPIMTVVNRVIEGRQNQWDSGTEHRVRVSHEHSNRNFGSYNAEIPRIRMREESKDEEMDEVQLIEQEIKDRIHKKRRILNGNTDVHFDKSNLSYATGNHG